MSPDNDLVPGDQTTPVADNATPVEGGVATQATPAQSPVDADALKAEYERKTVELQRDINRLKSTFQSREAQYRNETQRREAELLQELNQTRLATMDEETRKVYEAELAQSRIQELEQQIQDMQMENENYKVMQNAVNHFRSLGVPDDVMILDGTVDDLLQSGWDWVSQRVREINQTANQPAPVTPRTPVAPTLPIPPKVDVPGGTVSPARPSWDDMIKKFGSRETVYELFQAGRIPASQMPLD